MANEELLDARQWERGDENSLYEACVEFINAGLNGPGSKAYFAPDGKLIVASWSDKGKGWSTSRKKVIQWAKACKKTRANRKAVQHKLLGEIDEPSS